MCNVTDYHFQPVDSRAEAYPRRGGEPASSVLVGHALPIFGGLHRIRLRFTFDDFTDLLHCPIRPAVV